MFETPYQTTACSRFDMSKQATGIRKLEIQEELKDSPVVGVKVVPPGVVDFPPFSLPMTRKEIPSLECDCVIDGRALLRTNGSPLKEDVYNFHVQAAQMTAMWYTGDVGVRRDFLQTSDFSAKVFIRWLQQGATSRLGFDFAQITLFKAVAAVYWVQLHTPITESSTNEDKDRLLTRAARFLAGLDVISLKAMLGDVVPLNTLADMVNWFKSISDSPRTDQLTTAFVIQALIYTWGAGYREAVSVCLEYPPMFMAMLYNTCQQRSYTRTTLGKVVEETVYKNSDKEFLKNVDHLLGKR